MLFGILNYFIQRLSCVNSNFNDGVLGSWIKRDKPGPILTAERYFFSLILKQPSGKHLSNISNEGSSLYDC